ncbi:MAG TPA: LLM class flavin-dependent oxidoreductase [Acidimicrobiales bacterium]|jgi:probable F420-dependent oxidoreductase|nr:LLM class flavin-dependent oxidoreductase [Acidimicrobiales bacterium]
MPASAPVGVTMAPVMTLGLDTALELARSADELGYSSFWTAEVTGPEAFSVLGAVAATTSLSVGTGVLALQLRTPPLLAMAAATLQAMAPDRDVLVGIGISSPVVAGRWHGAGYGDRPLAQVREFVTLLRLCLSGEKVDFAGDFYSVKGFRLGVRPPATGRTPKVIIGALGEKMLKLSGEIADGVLLNYLPSSHVPWSVEQVRKGGDARIYAYVHTGVGDPADGDKPARFDLFSYAVVDSYARNFELAGYGDAVAEVRARHQAGDREGALAAVSDDWIKGIDFVGDEDEVRSFFQSYVDAGVEEPVLFPLPWGPDRAQMLRRTLEAVAPV